MPKKELIEVVDVLRKDVAIEVREAVQFEKKMEIEEEMKENGNLIYK